MFLGIRTVVYPAPELEAAKRFFSAALGIEPYFDEPFYVGFNPGGYELGLDPNAPVDVGPVTYWGVDRIESALVRLAEAGATNATQIFEPGDGIRMATVQLPGGGGLLGLIENPIFEITAVDSEGPGR